MKTTILFALFSLLVGSACLAEDKATPTGLTLIVCDSEDRVLDTVVVSEDAKETSVKFTLPKDLKEIRVFALGKRIHDDLPKGYFIKGRPDDKEWFGLGYVEVHIEGGVVVAIDGNGFGPLKQNKKLNEAIIADISEGKRATMTKVE